jgi:hypothetical protein
MLRRCPDQEFDQIYCLLDLIEDPKASSKLQTVATFCFIQEILAEQYDLQLFTLLSAS